MLAETRLSEDFQDRREYIPVGSGEKRPVFYGPESPHPIESLLMCRTNVTK